MGKLSQYPVESHLTPRQAHSFSKDSGWWRAIVRSEDKYGNEHIRFYLWRNDDTEGWTITHKWNIKPDQWEEEKAVVEKYVGKPPTHEYPHFPVQHYNVVGGETITKNDRWWTAVVQFEKSQSSTHRTRLYMWNLEDGEPKGTGFKWNISRDTWGEESTVADGFLSD